MSALEGRKNLPITLKYDMFK
ncbi:protein of unknown function [Trichlorobacter ammonificans]|uniref:Uncharacterized protein n=1 Tax=Trichlorobacter ammonificans TaxID=2916410 RepID=A0ABN8HIA3_9BACT|nr:protein of unknown function [Trichlorobacter ammonificans]